MWSVEKAIEFEKQLRERTESQDYKHVMSVAPEEMREAIHCAVVAKLLNSMENEHAV